MATNSARLFAARRERGPGPKWRAKHDSDRTVSDANVIRLGMVR